MFNPIKNSLLIFTITLTLSLLSFTHYQAFRWGTAAADNPLVSLWQGMKGETPQTSCPPEGVNSDSEPWLEELWEALD